VTSMAPTGKRPMSRSALIISTMAFLWALGCGGGENGTSSNASIGSSGSGSSGASSGPSTSFGTLLRTLRLPLPQQNDGLSDDDSAGYISANEDEV
jgi:hypothetical protein